VVWVGAGVAAACIVVVLIALAASSGSREAEAAPMPPFLQGPEAARAGADELPADAPLNGEQVYQRLLKSTVWVIARHEVGVAMGAAPGPPAGPEALRLLGQWSGSENLAGFGNLRFNFVSSTAVFMHDAKETIMGNWSLQGVNVTLRFYNGTVVYTGQINGQTISGSASNGKDRWTWSVSRGIGFMPPRPRPGQPRARPWQPPPAAPGGGKIEVTGTGSGVLVDRRQRLFLTNVHVVGNAGSVTVYFPEFDNDDLLAKREHYKDKPGITGKVVLKEDRADLALV
jgi:S1-C subfamily serine protease